MNLSLQQRCVEFRMKWGTSLSAMGLRDYYRRHKITFKKVRKGNSTSLSEQLASQQRAA